MVVNFAGIAEIFIFLERFVRLLSRKKWHFRNIVRVNAIFIWISINCIANVVNCVGTLSFCHNYEQCNGINYEIN